MSMQMQATNSTKKEIIITLICRDQVGLVRDITGTISALGINITDIDQSIVRGIFTITVVCDLSTSSLDESDCLADLNKELDLLKQRVSAHVMIEAGSSFVSGRAVADRYAKITILGKDAVGIVTKATSIVSKYGYNVESVSMVSREDIFAMEIVISYPSGHEQFDTFKVDIKNAMDLDRLSVFIQEKNVFTEEKKLVVFDMDSTLIREECIDELGAALNIKEKIASITDRAMEGKLDFTAAVKARVNLLRGLPVEVLERVAENLTLTPGAKELITSLKRMGYKVALISGGFTIFTNILKDKLGLDYGFANELIIKDGKLTGEINTNFIVDANQKAKIQAWLAHIEHIPRENIITIGDGANDAIMVKNSGLGVAFRAKKVLKTVATGIFNEDNLVGLLYALGDLKRKKYQQ